MSDSLDRRDFFVDSTVKAAKASGQEVDAEAVARQAARDLGVLDRALASGDIKSETAKEKPKPQPKADAAIAAAESRGQQFSTGSPTTEDPRLPKLSGIDALKLLAMDRRVRQICKQVPGYRFKCDKDGLLDEPIGNGCEYPIWANRIFMHTAGFSQGLTRGYIGLNYEDRQRKYNREIEKICDESDSLIRPPWWVR